MGLGILSTCPRIRKEQGKVIASTAYKLRFGTLGTVLRRVTINPKKRVISVQSRYAWFIRREHRIRFAEIAAITYGYQDFADSSLSFGHDSWDWFSVGLRLADDSEFHLFSFMGEGTFVNNGPLPDWMYWDEYAFDLSGSQEKQSRIFVDLLCHLTQTSVVPPRV